MLKSNPLFLLIGILTMLMSHQSKAQTDVWPQFRGANCSGVALENQDPPILFNKDQNVVWSIAISSGQSSPCIWQDRIFVTGFEEEDSILMMYCINRDSGTIMWERALPVKELEKRHAVSTPATATPATDGERVIFYFGSYGLLCYDLNGNLEWELPMDIPKSRWGMGTSPVITNDLVLLNCFGHINDPCLLALDKFTGEVKWKHSTPNPEGRRVDSYSTPVIYEDQVIIYRMDDVSAYDINSGEQVWRFSTGLVDAVSTPVIGDGILYFTMFDSFGNKAMLDQFPEQFSVLLAEYDENGDNLLTRDEVSSLRFLQYPEKGEVSAEYSGSFALGFWDLNRDSFVDSIEYTTTFNNYMALFYNQGMKAIKLEGNGELSMEDFLWGFNDFVPHVTSPLYYRGLVYMIKSGGILSCFKGDSGELLYSERLGAAGTYFASPVAVNGYLYFTSRNGVVTVIRAGEKLDIIAQNDLNERISATPAIVDNKLYLRSFNTLYAFGD